MRFLATVGITSSKIAIIKAGAKEAELRREEEWKRRAERIRRGRIAPAMMA